MRLGSKHQSEASFSFQINDAVKGHEDYLLAEDDFLRDVNDYTMTTPAPPSRTSILEHDRLATRGQMASGTDDHNTNADASLAPSLFAPSSPTRANVHHREAAATKGLNTPKPSIQVSKKPSTPKMMSGTRSTVKWPPPSREIGLPLPEASPIISTLANLREEITMLAEGDGVYPASIDKQQEEDTSDKRASSLNKSLLGSNLPPSTRIPKFTELRARALMNHDDAPAVFGSATQSTPSHEPPTVLSSKSLSSDKMVSEPVSTITVTDAMPELDGACSQNVIEPANTICCAPVEDSNRGGDGLLVERRRAASIDGDDQVDDPMAPLTISQLSPRKLMHRHDQSSALEPPITMPMSPMRPPRKRPSSAVTSNHEDEREKKGKKVPRTIRNHVTTIKPSAVRNPSRPGDADRRKQDRTVRRLVNSGSGSRLKSSELPSLSATTVSSSRARSQSRKIKERTRVQVDGRSPKRAASARREMSVNGPSFTGQNDVTRSATARAMESEPNTAPTSYPAGSSADSNSNDSCTGSQTGSTNRANAERSFDSRFKFRSEAREQSQHAEGQVTGTRHQSRSQSQYRLRSSGLLRTSNATAMSSSSHSSSNLHSIASMTRSQFRYSHHRPIPNYKAQHALLDSSLAQRKENIAPVVPLPLEMHTDIRAKERDKFDTMVKERERELERAREARRKEIEDQEEQELRELRRKAVPKANAVPEWYKDAPRTKRRVEQAQGSER